eukprot:TRINITY_DN63668_c0_g1_i1.p1 TRINITY_DN63668_c0_g1~~TRINITY_DN63668_c0_g1_i1.p1  ORF type:complete len:543 (-),score=100.62 TRINITY_DN63668_c0_g1_i1:118-1746(-)
MIEEQRDDIVDLSSGDDDKERAIPVEDEASSSSAAAAAVTTAATAASSKSLGARGPPLRFRGYRRGPELGSGASAKVYVCSKASSVDRLAVKAIDLQRLRLSKNPARQCTLLEREVDILKSLPPHPNIVRMLDAFEESDWFLFILELVPGGDLFSALTARQPSRLQEPEVAFVLAQVADGLAFLHSRAVIHRDLKLENVLVASEHRVRSLVFYDVKITDFGLSKDVGDDDLRQYLAGAHSKVGTRPYTAPEVDSGSAYDCSSDLWCLGIFLYVLLAGRFPFEHIPATQIDMDRIVRSIPCSEAVRATVSGLLQLEPRQRLSLDTILSSEWLQTSTGEQPAPKRQRISSASAVQIASAIASPLNIVVREEDDNKMLTAREILQQVDQRFMKLQKNKRERTLVDLLESLEFQQVVVFVRSAWNAKLLEKVLAKEGIAAVAIHSGISNALQADRYNRFKAFQKRVLVLADDCISIVCSEAFPRVDVLLCYDASTSCEQYMDRASCGGNLFRAQGCIVTFAVSDEDVSMLQMTRDQLEMDIAEFIT